MTGPSSHGRRRIVATVMVLLLVTASLTVAPLSTAAATNGDIRQADNGSLVVTVEEGQEGFTGGKVDMSIDVAGVESFQRQSEPKEGTYRFTVSATTLAESNLSTTDLSNATVTATSGDTSFNRSLDLRHVLFRAGENVAGGESASFNGGALELSAERVIGVKNGTNVPLTVVAGGSEQKVTGTLVHSQGGAVVRIERGVLKKTAALAKPSSVTFSSDAAFVANDLSVNLRNIAETTATTTGQGLVLSNPLLVADQSYVINLTLGGADGGQYIREVTTAEGSLSLSEPAAAKVAPINRVVLTRDGVTVVDDTNLNTTREKLWATVDSTNATVTVPELPGGAIETVYVTTTDSSNVTELRDYQFDSENGTLTFTTDTFSENITALLVEFTDGSSVYAEVPTSGGDAPNQSGDGPLEGGNKNGGDVFAQLVGFAESQPVITVLVVGLLIGGFLVFRWYVNRSTPSRRGSTARLGGTQSNNSVRSNSQTNRSTGRMGGANGATQIPEKARITLRVKDALTDAAYRGSPMLVATPSDHMQGEKRVDMSGGQQTIEFKTGEWTMKLVEGGETLKQGSSNIEPQHDGESRRMVIDPYELTVEVDEPSGGGRPLNGATVRATTASGQQWTETTDGQGRAALQVPRHVSDIELIATHDGYNDVSTAYDPTRDGRTFTWQPTLTPDAGTVEATVSLGGQPVPGVPVTLSPTDERARSFGGERTGRTDEGGTVRLDGVASGRYRASATPNFGSLTVETDSVETAVRTDETARVDLDVRVSFTLSEAQRERLASLRSRVDGLTTATNRDVAIPYYFGSVIEAVLDDVERVEREPEQAVVSNTTPGAVVDALLDAAEDGIASVEGAMNDKRNIKLFRACDSMDGVEVSWDGSSDLNVFYDRLEDGSGRQRRALRNRLQEADEFLNERWSDVGEIGPPRQIHERVGELARSQDSDDVTEVARVHVSLCLLDAVESLFEQQPLRDRLDSAVY